MKQFLFIIFLFFTLFINSQTIEDIYYTPSASGHYDNLIVKGNVDIKKLSTATFNIHSYSSLLNLRVVNADNTLDIEELNVLNPNGTATFTTEGNMTSAQANINSGFLSFSFSQSGINPIVNISGIVLPKVDVHIPTINFNTHNFTANNNANSALYVDNLEIFGMKIPQQCYNGYYWQDIKIGSNSYTVLACNTTNCPNPQKEEDCVTSGNFWVTTFNALGVCWCSPYPWF